MKKISVITRTKDRAVFLRRCADDLINQRFPDMQWVIVNDGGNPKPVDEISAYARGQGLDCLVVHLKDNVGLPEGSNTGIRESASQYIHLHDDDDSLEPGFYENMCGFLDKDVKGHFGGVVCSTNRIDERVTESRIEQLSKRPIHHSKNATHIADILTKNQFSPISFVYRRSCLASVGHYDTNLPVLDDWDFNIRFLMQFDIASVYDYLANYHFRSIKTGPLAQTVQSSLQHELFAAVLRNKYFREGTASIGNAMPGLLMNVGRNFQIQHGRTLEIQDHQRSEWTLKRALKAIASKLNMT
ncbi:MAG: glycosyltransferase family A protein [Aquabacterium sp.]|jgi:glycosyltransferase involved in cell wall biosynthesis|uniref:glycosyltransferase family 2 protein n=1 Tax=Aquabacterium sp. TaxID=1872578 RepID=UPI002A36F1F8|nr:glycosyltransferase family A protein [Aquabacterium sp.]MDX9843848.1 glycosyltransferase family A protein [Aquabacterium sp.]